MTKPVITQIEQMLADSASSRTWGTIEIDIRDGRATLIRQTTQYKVEDNPAHASSNRR
jgi:hypothetical protein